MIFSQYRDSVQEITACLHEHRPLVKVMEFVGQAGTKGESVSTSMPMEVSGSRMQDFQTMARAGSFYDYA